MFLSASQLKMVFPIYKHNDETHCKRSWYNKYVKKLPVPDRDFTNLGTVLHSCIENYLESGDLDTGDPFPGGWDKGLRSDESDKVRELVELGIEEGYIVKSKKRMIEMSIGDGKDHTTLLRKLKPEWDEDWIKEKATQCWEIVPGVLLTGFIDYYYNINKIIDWKTSSDPMKYGLKKDSKSTKYIGFDLQLLLYATFLRKVMNVQGPIEVAHVYFRTKKEAKVLKVSHTFSPEDLDEFYEWLTTVAIPDMLELKEMKEGVVVSLEHGKEACNRYGGCPYKPICSGNRTEEEYKIIHSIGKGESKMGKSLMDMIKDAGGELEADSKKSEGKEVSIPAVEDTSKNEAVVEETAPAPTPEEQEAVEELKEKVEEIKETQQEVEAKVTPKKRKGSTLCIGCQPIRGCKPVSLTMVFREIVSAICTELGEDDWYKLDPFKRRELFHQNVESVLDYADGKTLVAMYLEPDYSSLLQVLRDNAKSLVEAMGL